MLSIFKLEVESNLSAEEMGRVQNVASSWDLPPLTTTNRALNAVSEIHLYFPML